MRRLATSVQQTQRNTTIFLVCSQNVLFLTKLLAQKSCPRNNLLTKHPERRHGSVYRLHREVRMEEEILGINEIATLAGVSSQAVTNWRARATDFPKPISNLASGPVFRRSQIRAWLIRNNRKLASFEGGSSYYGRLRNFRGDNDELAACIEKVANRLHEVVASE